MGTGEFTAGGISDGLASLPGRSRNTTSDFMLLLPDGPLSLLTLTYFPLDILIAVFIGC